MQSAYDDEDDEDDNDDDDLENSESYEKAKRGKGKNKNAWNRIKILLQPTSNWGPSQNSFTPSNTLTRTSSSGNDFSSFRMSMIMDIKL